MTLKILYVHYTVTFVTSTLTPPPRKKSVYLYNKTPQHLPHGQWTSQFKNSATAHYEHINNTFSLSPTTVKVQKKVSYNLVHFLYLAILSLATGPWTYDPGTMTFTILIKGYMDIIIIHLVFSQHVGMEKKMAFLRNSPWQWGPRGGLVINLIPVNYIPLVLEMLHIKKR